MLGGALGVALSEPAYAILMVERVGFCPDPTHHLERTFMCLAVVIAVC